MIWLILTLIIVTVVATGAVVVAIRYRRRLILANEDRSRAAREIMDEQKLAKDATERAAFLAAELARTQAALKDAEARIEELNEQARLENLDAEDVAHELGAAMGYPDRAAPAALGQPAGPGSGGRPSDIDGPGAYVRRRVAIPPACLPARSSGPGAGDRGAPSAGRPGAAPAEDEDAAGLPGELGPGAS